MRITTDRKAALADTSNRMEAGKQIQKEHGFEIDLDDFEQWIDDLINEWVDELAHDLQRGICPA